MQTEKASKVFIYHLPVFRSIRNPIAKSISIRQEGRKYLSRRKIFKPLSNATENRIPTIEKMTFFMIRVKWNDSSYHRARTEAFERTIIFSLWKLCLGKFFGISTHLNPRKKFPLAFIIFAKINNTKRREIENSESLTQWQSKKIDNKKEGEAVPWIIYDSKSEGSNWTALTRKSKRVESKSKAFGLAKRKKRE